MALDREDRGILQDRHSWFARQLGEGWVSAGGGIYYPPEENRAESAVAIESQPSAPDPSAAPLRHRRRELVRLRERAIERVSRFPNPVAELQLKELEQEIAAVVGRLGRLVTG